MVVKTRGFGGLLVGCLPWVLHSSDLCLSSCLGSHTLCSGATAISCQPLSLRLLQLLLSLWAFALTVCLLETLPFSRGYRFRVLPPRGSEHKESLGRVFKFRWPLLLLPPGPHPPALSSSKWSLGPVRCVKWQVFTQEQSSPHPAGACHLVNKDTNAHGKLHITKKQTGKSIARGVQEGPCRGTEIQAEN